MAAPGRRRWRGLFSREAPSAGPAAPGPKSEEELRARVPWPSFPPPGYLGQLDDEFQRRLAADRAGLAIEDCRFYHSVEFRDGTVVPGPWDLRGREREYLGGVSFAGQRVLEMGPSSGYLTFWMEDQGAEVVGFDAGYDVPIDVLPSSWGDPRELAYDHLKMAGTYQNAWWLLHRDRGAKAKIAYGDVNDLPGDLGTFDIATFTAILLHLRSPITALEQAARRTRDTIVVTEPVPDPDTPLDANVMRFFPLGEQGRWVIWWSIHAGAVVAMLECLGFGDVEVTEHSQLHQPGHDASIPYVETPMYTVVGRRKAR